MSSVHVELNSAEFGSGVPSTTDQRLRLPPETIVHWETLGCALLLFRITLSLVFQNSFHKITMSDMWPDVINLGSLIQHGLDSIHQLQSDIACQHTQVDSSSLTDFYHYVVSLTLSTLAIYARIVLSLGLKTRPVADPLQGSHLRKDCSLCCGLQCASALWLGFALEHTRECGRVMPVIPSVSATPAFECCSPTNLAPEKPDLWIFSALLETLRVPRVDSTKYLPSIRHVEYIASPKGANQLTSTIETAIPTSSYPTGHDLASKNFMGILAPGCWKQIPIPRIFDKEELEQWHKMEQEKEEEREQVQKATHP
ncbi:uncharacterized protein EV420DRAFT_1486137 [Desarmillaria tabescens]|uniref:Uncharacterized protein n=1 Tax=Armillaria tabescens TaxID=1929756 RepID=A0AA39JC03_ARMTA|nr:uncharacterized protein EV420DRAFT_1486137 [Desarmillaria tabescens]KAK0439956.1 hypothetical protein EV420DRAFT_1486137 [Desarmillaria tabescens]